MHLFHGCWACYSSQYIYDFSWTLTLVDRGHFLWDAWEFTCPCNPGWPVTNIGLPPCLKAGWTAMQFTLWSSPRDQAEAGLLLRSHSSPSCFPRHSSGLTWKILPHQITCRWIPLHRGTWLTSACILFLVVTEKIAVRGLQWPYLTLLNWSHICLARSP